MPDQTKTQWTANSILQFLKDHREQLKAMGVQSIGLFGSYARDEQSEDSDVDMLFSMTPFTWAGWMDVWNFLEDNLGMSVDLVPEKDLREEIRPQILTEVRYVEEL